MYEIHLMITIFFHRGGGLAAAALVPALAAIACSGTVGRWDGTVDAGFRYRTAEKQTIVGDVPAGSFAERAGLAPNDIVVAVDGVDVTNATAAEVLAAVRGPSGSVARLTVARDGGLVEIAVERTPRDRARAAAAAAAGSE
jgi:C-terminal processing protease CtpA/Prc